MTTRTSDILLDVIPFSLFGFIACWMTSQNPVFFIPFSVVYFILACRRRYFVVMGMLISFYMSTLFVSTFMPYSRRFRYPPSIWLDPDLYLPFLICFVGGLIGYVFDRVNARPIETEQLDSITPLLPPSETAPLETLDNEA